MTITISVAGGVDFNAYLQNFEDTFVRNGNGFFSDNPRDGDGDEFAQASGPDGTLPVDDGLSYIAKSGEAGDFVYDFQNNIVAGALDGLQFGDGLAYDVSDDNFSTDASVTIRGLGLSGTGVGNDVSTLLGELRESDLTYLRSLLAGDDIDFKGSTGNDAFRSFGGDDDIAGRSGADTVYGGNGDDEIEGGDGADTLFGNKNDDDVDGGKGADEIDGGDGNDTLDGGSGGGDDQLTGGKGKNQFEFEANNFGDDQILDFDAGKAKTDRISFDDDVFADFASVKAAAEDNADGDVVITVDGDSSVTLVGVSEADLRAYDFIFD